ncbi:hypothetical protein Taro_049611 [Colocasia esculenta]|uniref:DUF4219 domain-containing protein n=1 Tax=Colocasia esculenta TaxID=4460 RepID=A0A843XB78_COLES|nr:hypothetical protein [Colocasia esculenta]
MATQGYAEGQSVNRPPLFDGEDYNYWKTRMEFFLQGLDSQLWSIIEEGDLVVLNNRENWTDGDKKKVSLNSKAKSILCCVLSKKEFNRISACKSAMEMWEKLRITYEGTDKVKETRIDILVAQYERFQMQLGEPITQMYNRFTDITNGLAGLEKLYEIGDMVRKILRSLPTSWTPKVTAIEEANDLRIMSLEKLIGSLMAHEINMERLRESSSKKTHNNALKATEETTDGKSKSDKSNESSEDKEAFLSRRLQRILAKKKIQKAMVAAWNNESDSDSESSFSEEEEEKANLAFMANVDDKKLFLFDSMAVSGSSGNVGGYNVAFLTADQQE